MPNPLEGQVLDGKVLEHNGRYDITFHRHYDTTVERLWDIVTVPELLVPWMGGPVPHFELKKGGAVEIFIHPAGPATVYGKVLELDPGHRVTFSWEVPAWGNRPDLKGTTMTFEVKPDGNGASLSLIHSLPAEHVDRAPELTGAWHLHLDMIPSIISGEHKQYFQDVDFFAARATYIEFLGPIGPKA
jgi:uncharacterized protein YndB with AHSA1/START domain